MKKTSSYSVIPENAAPCVWMDAGVTEFKLCDQQFHCDACAFHREIRQQRGAAAAPAEQEKPLRRSLKGALTGEGLFKNILNDRMEELRAANIQSSKLFSKSHYWTEQHGPNTHRIGLNHILARFLQPILSIVVSKAPINLHRLDPFCWIILPGGAVTLRAPIDATAARFNHALQQKPGLLNTSPFDEGWIMEITTKSKGLSGFMPSGEFRPHAEEALQNIEHVFTHAYQDQAESVGSTLFDGGASLENIETVFGPKTYLEIVNRIAHSPL